jgi:nitroreductase
MTDRIATLENIIANRRTTKPARMNGNKIDDDIVWQLLQMADWAPTHGNTEPWYFVVFSGDKVRQFCFDHAEMYRTQTAIEKFSTESYEKYLHQGDKASHVIAICMKRGSNPKIPEQEEMASVACAVQNMWLDASARGIAAYWGSGGMAYHPAMREYLGLSEQDKVLGFFYLGYSDDPHRIGRRIKQMEEKVKWM